jgi:hypothetical protein
VAPDAPVGESLDQGTGRHAGTKPPNSARKDNTIAAGNARDVNLDRSS